MKQDTGSRTEDDARRWARAHDPGYDDRPAPSIDYDETTEAAIRRCARDDKRDDR